MTRDDRGAIGFAEKVLALLDQGSFFEPPEPSRLGAAPA